MPTVNLQVSYRRPLRFGDEAEISVRVWRVGAREAVFDYEMRRATSGELTAECTHTVAFIDVENWQAVRSRSITGRPWKPGWPSESRLEKGPVAPPGTPGPPEVVWATRVAA
jgi:hypothetical protein